MAKILIVDDNRFFRNSLAEILASNGYDAEQASTGEEALKILAASQPDLIISDLLMPGIDGFELCRHVRDTDNLPNIPFIFCSGFFPRKEQQELSRLLAVEDFFTKPVDMEKLLAAVQRNLDHATTEPKEAFKKEHEEFYSSTHAELVKSKLWSAVEQEREQRARAEALVQQLQKNLEGFIMAVAKAVEARDPYTAGHQRRVATLACAIASEMGLDEDAITGIRLGATIHDIGKIQVPSELLVKPSALSAIEFEMIKTHPKVGYDILSSIDSPWPIAEIAHQHHERMDGSGYPQGIKGDEIIPEIRVVMVADVVEAMMSHRPYRPALGKDAAIEEITKNRDTLYDTSVVDSCLQVFEKGFSFEEDAPPPNQ
jgi:putative two-component system response regulator